MIWTLHRWVWRLKSPLFIGMPPAGSLSRCRLYLLARTLHGALAAEIARLKHGDARQPDYGKIGWELALNCRFTYLYPAEKSGEVFLPWLPKYENGKGCQWHRKGDEETATDREFRRRLLTSRAGTAIAPESDSASEGTLRETECMNPWWRDETNSHAEPKPVFLLGYLFLRNNGFRRQLSSIDNLFVGGDTRYGLGEITLATWDDLPIDELLFGKRVTLTNEDPQVYSNFVWGDVPINGHTPNIEVRGAKELLGGWEMANPFKGCLAWAPGSFLVRGQERWAIDTYGNWIYEGVCQP